jgi:hypothetical protein
MKDRCIRRCLRRLARLKVLGSLCRCCMASLAQHLVQVPGPCRFPRLRMLVPLLGPESL